MQVAVAQAVDLTDHFEQHGAGFRRVEVVVHRCAETFDEGLAPGWRRLRQATQGMVETLQGALGFLEAVFRVVDGAAVMAGDQQVAHHFGVILIQHLADGEEVAQGLGHFLAIHAHRPGVHPGIGVELAGGGLALGDFVLVVREHQVRAAAVDVEGLA
uniref:Uncharacterized protein n=1 Tax=biofilter metagenome TaxID=1070537 RepID=A0A193SBV0_9ZZZZ